MFGYSKSLSMLDSKSVGLSVVENGYFCIRYAFIYLFFKIHVFVWWRLNRNVYFW